MKSRNKDKPDMNKNKKKIAKKTDNIPPVISGLPPIPVQQNTVPGDVPVLEISPEQFKEILNAAVKNSQKKIESQKDADILKSLVKEYMSAFILIGYGVNNNRIVIKAATNERDEDALIEELRFVFFKLCGGM